MTIEERNELIIKYIPLANKIAFQKNKTTPKNITLDEIKSAAYMGLIDAATKFRPELCSFPTYAKFRIIGSIKDYLKNIKIDFCELKDYYFSSSCDYDNLDLFPSIFSFLDYTGQNVIKMYYIENKSMKHIGDFLGVSESRISQMIAKYKKIIRNKIK
jgi:RNA polymerase sigma factor (sigma-70 family)